MPLRKEARYFISLIPPSPVYEDALQWKNFFKDHYNSKASLNSPPHITLHMPFLWKEEKELLLAEKLNEFAGSFQPIEIELDSFGCFEPRVIFMQVKKTPALAFFQKEMERFCKRTFQLFHADYRDLAYHPHITLAFRDLKKTFFANAWNEVKDKTYQHRFTASHFTLLRHNGTVWLPLKEFDLSHKAKNS